MNKSGIPKIKLVRVSDKRASWLKEISVMQQFSVLSIYNWSSLPIFFVANYNLFHIFTGSGFHKEKKQEADKTLHLAVTAIFLMR